MHLLCVPPIFLEDIMKKVLFIIFVLLTWGVITSCQDAERAASESSDKNEISVSLDESVMSSDVVSDEESLSENDSSDISDDESCITESEISEELVSDAQSSEAVDETDSYDYAKRIYTEYLLNGGYDDVLYLRNFEHDTVKLYTYMLDLNGDGGYELFIKSLIGYRGGYCALLGIEDGTVKVLAVAEDGGGSMGGSYLDYMYDSKNDKQVMVYRGNIRAGWTAQGGHFYVLSNDELYSGTEEAPAYSVKHDSSKLHLSYMADMIAEIKAVTDVYTEDEEYFYAYEINGEYVEKDEYENSIKSYSSIEVDFYEGSLEEPIR